MEGMKDFDAGQAGMYSEIATPLIQAYGAKRSNDFKARQLKRNAQAINAKGNRESIEIKRQGKILASNARASQAGSGGVTTDVGAIEQTSGIKNVSDHNAMTALFEANTQADSKNLEARALKSDSQRQMLSGVTQSISTVLKNSDKIFVTEDEASAKIEAEKKKKLAEEKKKDNGSDYAKRWGYGR